MNKVKLTRERMFKTFSKRMMLHDCKKRMGPAGLSQRTRKLLSLEGLTAFRRSHAALSTAGLYTS